MSEFFTILGGLLLGIIPIVMGSIIVAIAKDEEFADGYSRTPLGGFFNHSETPNCEAYADGRFIKLVTINPILKGDELTAYYWLYETDDFE